MMASCCDGLPAHVHVRHFLSRGLCRYGHVVARYPWMFILIPSLIFGGLGFGVLKMETYTNSDEVNIPTDSQSLKDQATVERLFSDRTADNYDALELNENQIMGSIIFAARNNASVYDEHVVKEIRDVISDVKTNVTVLADGVTLTYEDLCGKRMNECVVTGARLLDPQFDAMRGMGILTYPKWKLPTTGVMVDLSFALADSDKKLKRVGVVRVTFKLRHDLKPEVFLWEDAFVDLMKNVKVNNSDIVYTSSRSISQALERNVQADLTFIWMTLAVIAMCTCVAACGGDVVSTRALLVPMGVVSPALGVIGAMGLLSLCEVKVADTVWVMPLLVLGVGVTDTYLVMISWSSRLDRVEGGVEERVGCCVSDVGPPITVTSLSLFIALCAAHAASFPSVASFGLYAGVAVLFTYLSTMTVGVASLAIHARRVIASRHVITCSATSPRDQLKKEGRPPCYAFMFGGAVPRDNYEDESVFEKFPRLVLVKLIKSIVARAVIGVVYVVLLAVSIYGIISLKNGVELTSMVTGSSYVRDYLNTDSQYFGFSFPVVFVMDERMTYNNLTANLVARLLVKAKQNPGIETEFVRCWLTDFLQSPYYNRTSDGENFPVSVVEEFLNSSTTFGGDVVLDQARDRIVASRCYVFSTKTSDQEKLTQLMVNMRSLATDAGVPVFAYHPAFLAYDQRLAVLPTLFQCIGIAVLLLCVLYVAVFPEVYTTVTVIASALSTMVATLGLMHFWGVSVSFVSLTYVILNAGFAVYFSVHVSAAYLQSELTSRAERVIDAASRAAVPILTLTLCMVFGVLVLLAATSYHFSVLFKVTFLTLLLSLFHAVLFTSTVLWLLGPEKSQEELDKDESVRKAMMIEKRDKPAGPSGDRDIVSSYFQTKTVTKTGSVSVNSHGTGAYTPRSKRNRQFVGHNNHLPGSSAVSQIDNPNKENVSCTVSVVDYPNSVYDNLRHSLSSNSYENVEDRVPSCEYCKTPRKYKASTIHYENWPGRYRTVPSELYDVPASSIPSNHGRSWNRPKRHRHRRSLDVIDDYVNIRSLGGTAERTRTTSPKAVKHSPSRNNAGSGKGSKRSKPQPRRDIDIVSSLGGFDDVNGYPVQNEPVSSLEGVHHVACTLSTNGKLGSTQAYVTENFGDIPS
ncbi:patched domain-containing protein 3-like [Littorina saxatilis]|uniref:SSD domain-containing protein n=1 Tax=Littorina saxatilis TaxID=31220 RepID=A0AAN9B8R9_9CAEN